MRVPCHSFASGADVSRLALEGSWQHETETGFLLGDAYRLLAGKRWYGYDMR